MKRQFRVYYHITTFDGWWWQKRKWVKEYNPQYRASSHASCFTFKKALKIANKCPAEMIITKNYFKHGKRWCREMILGRKK